MRPPFAKVEVGCILFVLVFVSCATSPPMPDPPPTHPASPRAEAAPAPPPSDALQMTLPPADAPRAKRRSGAMGGHGR